MGMPHRPQNLMPAGYVCPQRGQVIPLGDGDGGAGVGVDGVAGNSPVTGWNVVLPQRPQNFTPSAKRDWHLVHITTTSVVEC